MSSASESCHPTPKHSPENEIPQRGSVIGAIKKAVFVIGTALILFGTIRNTITWYFELIWGSSKDFWQSKWQTIHDFVDGDEKVLSIIGTNLVGFLVYWIGSLFFCLVDLTGRPAWVLRYKIQDNKQVPVDRKKFIKAVLLVLFNQTITVPIFSVFYWLYKWRGCSFGRELPSFHWVLFEIGMFTLVEEFLFYYAHRLLHHPRIYKHIHKIHHEWTAPISITAVYAHPVEHIISNVFPVLMGPLVMGSHIATGWLWFAVAISTTLVSHCGYHLPLLPSPEAHDYHHQKFNQNFGVLGVLDWLHGTDAIFRQSRAYDRHVYFFNTTSMKEMYPDDPAKGCKKN
ncbi:fatty acid hydroxylase domain-containing 2-like [Paramuricea clavata]|uniref:Fatty acid hydroxylase domain-containing 2-like n=1 Tax=Paramuricea clavata TaxID=317549 RepID=A0A7D9L6L8_PARCT|nr:fatty acid hydroxylase domain-containing 2-like [Paramuricea clavata]